MTTQIIMVQIANRQWTLGALHRACILAREINAEIALMTMLPVQHVQWLGTEFGNMNFTARERAELRDYEATVEDYGLKYSSYQFQYITLAEAISEAADYVDAQIVFATIPKSIIPFWQQFQLRCLRNRLADNGRELFDDNRPLTSKLSEMAKVSPIPANDFSDR